MDGAGVGGFLAGNPETSFKRTSLRFKMEEVVGWKYWG